MSEIPESVALEAKKIVDAMPARTPWKHEVEDAIALAILAERSRCIACVESFSRDGENYDYDSGPNPFQIINVINCKGVYDD